MTEFGISSDFIYDTNGQSVATRLSDHDIDLGSKLRKSDFDMVNKGVINVDSLGADPSLSDNSQAFIAALNTIKNVMNGRGKLTCSAGVTYQFTSPIGLFNMSNIEIDLNGSTLDFSALPPTIASTYLGFNGIYGSIKSLSANVLLGTKVITVQNTSGFLAGDMVRVYSNKQFDSTRTQSRIGEIGYVDTVDSLTQLTLKTSLNFDYNTSDLASIQKLNVIENVYIHNGKFVGTVAYNEHYAIELQVSKNCLIENIEIENVHKRQIVITDGVNINVDNCSFKRALHTSQAYGVSFVDCTRDSVCSKSHFEGVRHSLSINNNVSTSWGQPRNILFVNNTVINSSRNLTDGGGGDAIDTHAGGENIFIIGNNVYGASGSGINFEARSGIIANNVIIDTEILGINFNPRSDFKSKILITGNRLERIGKTAGSIYGIQVSLTVVNCEKATVSINQVDSLNQSIRCVGTATCKFEKLVILGNEGEVSVSSYGIHVEYANNAVISSNNLKAPDVAIFTNEINNSSIMGNTGLLYGTGVNAWGVRLSGNCSYNSVTGNTMKDTGSGRSTGAWGVIFASTVTFSGIFNNVTQGFITNVTASTGTGNVAANNI
jgi:hypothetical protein